VVGNGSFAIYTNHYQCNEICSIPQSCTSNPKFDYKLHLTILRLEILPLDSIPNPLIPSLEEIPVGVTVLN